MVLMFANFRSGKSHLKLLRTKAGNAHQAAVGGIQFSGDGLHVVSMSIDRTLRIWDARTMEARRTISVSCGYIFFWFC